ncbi:MAG: T9SS type A sorting domain-containing protein, partial [Bacteroidota bacterium]
SIPNLLAFGETKHRHNTVDGWGKLILPHDTFDVIRIKSDLLISDTIFLDTFNFGYRLNHTQTEYKWLTKGIGIPVLKATKVANVTTVEYYDTTNSVGITENNILNITVFPNPVRDEINVSSSEPIYSIEMMNQTGEIVYSKKYADSELQKRIYIPDLSDGIYVFKCFDKNKRLICIKKIVKIN